MSWPMTVRRFSVLDSNLHSMAVSDPSGDT